VIAVAFSSPLWLLALLAVPALLGLQQASRARRRRYAVRFPAAASLAAAAPAVSQWPRRVPPVLAVLAAGLLALAMAKPEKTVRVPIDRASVVLITDHSGSMQATDVDPSRLDAAKKSANTFIDEVPAKLRVGVVGFSDDADIVQAPTTNHDDARRVIDAQAPLGATATGNALQTAIDLLRPSGARKIPSAIVLLSDGATTTGSDPLVVAEEAAKRGIPVYTVALGKEGTTISPNGAFGRQLDVSPDPQTLAEISRITKGKAFSADDSGRLESIYKQLGSQLGTKAETREITRTFVIAGLLLLAAAGMGGVLVRGRVA
jgi:Ca-activated chloride channel family protein